MTVKSRSDFKGHKLISVAFKNLIHFVPQFKMETLLTGYTKDFIFHLNKRVCVVGLSFLHDHFWYKDI